MAYPTATNLRDHLVTVGILADASDPLAASLNLDLKIAAATTWFESLAKRRFSSISAVRYFDAPKYGGDTLHFDDDLLTVSSVTLDGQVLVEGTNYDLLPYNEPTKYGLKFRTIPVLDTLWGIANKSIAVSGTWGSATSCPADVFQAILILGASLVDEFMSSGSSEQIKLGQDTFGSGGSANSEVIRPGGYVDAVVKKYERWYLV